MGMVTAMIYIVGNRLLFAVSVVVFILVVATGVAR